MPRARQDQLAAAVDPVAVLVALRPGLPLFSIWLRVHMATHGVSAAALAAACGVGQSAVQNWMAGTRLPRRETLTPMSEALRVSPGELLERLSGARAATTTST